MSRTARILRQEEDAFGDGWDIREERPTTHGFPLLLGWPAGLPRGRGGTGGPRVVLTEPLVGYLAQHRHDPAGIILPIGRTAVQRLRRVLGHHWRADRPAWWEERAVDLADLTLDEFARRHDVSVGAASQARTALFGPSLRPAGWWRAAETAALLVSSQPRAYVAEQLGIAVGSVGRLRWVLRAEQAASAPAP